MSEISEILNNAIKNKKLMSDLSDIIQYLENDYEMRWQIYREVEKENHKEDIYQEICYYNEENDTNIAFTDNEIDLILEQYEDSLGDSEEWSFILNNILECWIEEKLND